MTKAFCGKAPDGWRCTRENDHEGPCVAVPEAQIMTERTLLQQLLLLRLDIESTPMLDRFAAEQRERWATRLADLLERRRASMVFFTDDPDD